MNWIITTVILLASPAWASEQPPELWSWFKDLDKSKEACEIQSSYLLQSIALKPNRKRIWHLRKRKV